MAFRRRWEALCALVVALILAAWPVAGEEQPAAEALSLDAVVREVLDQNPSIRAARADWEAMKQRVPQARAWEDPRVGVDVERSDTTKLSTYTDNEWMIAQEIPITGKNRKRARVADAEAAATFQELRRRELDLTADARTAYYRLANAHEQLDVNRKNETLLRQLLEISRTKYEVGRRPQADVLVANTDLVRQIESRVDIERQLSDERSQLNVLMNRLPQEALARPASLTFSSVTLEPEHVQALAAAHRPELLIAQDQVSAAKARWELARREWFPDPELRVEARQFNGASGFIQEYDTGIFLRFPWINHSKYRAGIAEAKRRLESAEHDLEARQQETRALVRDQLVKISTFHHHTELFRGQLVPLARQAVRAQQAAYETDRSDFIELISTRRTAHEVESTYWHHLTDYLMGVAELEAIVGASPTDAGSAK